MEIEDRHLDMVKKILTAHVPNCEVRAFGSRATGGSKKHSDLDIAIVSPCGKKLEWRVVPSLINAFQESRIPFRVDVLDYYGAHRSFRKIIDDNYCVI